MTEKELRKLKFLPRERERLKKAAEEAKLEYASCREHSVVMGSRACEPYDLHAITVAAPCRGMDARAALKKRRKAERKLAACTAELDRLNAFIDGIQDPQMYALFDMYYRQGKTWLAVAKHMGWSDESWPRKLSKKYLEQSEKSDFGDV